MSLITETNQKHLTFLKLSDFRDYEEESEYFSFLTDLSSTNVKLSIGTFMEPLKVVVVEG